MLQTIKPKGDSGDHPENRIEHDAVEHVSLDVRADLVDHREDLVLALWIVAKEADDLAAVIAGFGRE